jgi:hypothetical protein
MPIPHSPVIGKITQPVNLTEKGSVSFTGLPNTMSTLDWSGTTTGSTSTGAATGFTVTGLTIGTYYFTVTDIPDGTSLPTTVVIAVQTVTELSSSGYRLFEKTGIGDGPAEAAFNVEFAAIDRQIFVETNYTPEEIVLGNIK